MESRKSEDEVTQNGDEIMISFLSITFPTTKEENISSKGEEKSMKRSFPPSFLMLFELDDVGKEYVSRVEMGWVRTVRLVR